MKYLVRVITIIIFVLILSGCNRTKASWQFIMDKGGIVVGDPYQYKSSTYLPVECYASGLEAVSVKPVDITSYPIYYTRGKADLAGNSIEIELYYSLDKEGKDINRIKIPDIKPGEYKVFYNDIENSKVFIDKVTF